MLQGIVCLSSFLYVLEHIYPQERRLVEDAISVISPGINYQKIVHVGGLAVTGNLRGIGWGALLFRIAERQARELGYTLSLGHTARRSEKYPSLKILDTLVKWREWRELSVSETIFYPSPPDLEKVWCYKPC